MKSYGADTVRDPAILVSRVLLMLVFVTAGWGKLNNFSGTSAFMASNGLPMPAVAAVVATAVELVVGIAIVLGFLTRPLAIFMAIYTLATAIIGHHYWTMSGPAQIGNMLHFYKNMGIIGGLILLYITGPGRYSVDAKSNIL